MIRPYTFFLAVLVGITGALPLGASPFIRHDFTGTAYSGSNQIQYPNANALTGWFSAPEDLGGPLSAGDLLVGSIWIDLSATDSNADGSEGSFPGALVGWTLAISDSDTGATLLTLQRGAAPSSRVTTDNDVLINAQQPWYQDEIRAGMSGNGQVYNNAWTLEAASFTWRELANDPADLTVLNSDALPSGAINLNDFTFRRMRFEFRDLADENSVFVVFDLDGFGTNGVVTDSLPVETPLPASWTLLGGLAAAVLRHSSGHRVR